MRRVRGSRFMERLRDRERRKLPGLIVRRDGIQGQMGVTDDSEELDRLMREKLELSREIDRIRCLGG